MNLKRNKKGFTLVELIVVLIIIGILLAMVIPNLTAYIDRARTKNVEANARNAYMAAMTLAAEEYAAKATDTVDDDAVKGLSGVTGAVDVTTAGGKVTVFSYTEDEITVSLNTDGVLAIEDPEEDDEEAGA